MTTSAPNSADKELQIHLNALKDLGPEYTDAVAASLLERIDRVIDARVDARFRDLVVSQCGRADSQIKLLATTFALGIPITAIAGGIAELAGIIAVWLGLAFIIFITGQRR